MLSLALEATEANDNNMAFESLAPNDIDFEDFNHDDEFEAITDDMEIAWEGNTGGFILLDIQTRTVRRQVIFECQKDAVVELYTIK